MLNKVPASKKFTASDPAKFKLKALLWANSFEHLSFFDSNGFADPYSAFDSLIAAGCQKELIPNTGNSFSELENFLEGITSYIPGYFSYDLKNELEDLQSANPDRLEFPGMYFFIPKHVICIKGAEVDITSDNPDGVWEDINAFSEIKFQSTTPIRVKSRFNRAEYQSAVGSLKDHILRGDIYEINFCQEFYAEDVDIDPVQTFIRLNALSPTPFANFMKIGSRFILSATPERFLSKRGNKLISQPIKGTSARSADKIEDENKKRALLTDEKERAENVMIVDLVRNDLTKSAKPGTVQVEELFGIYSFSQVHQLISTIICEVAPGLTNAQVIANTFPMGSMTGAPKVSAMKLAEKYERTKRGVYSGAVGYFAPNGDFDFNVIIRTLLYNKENKYLSFHTGGAITIDSEPGREYEECLLKAKAIMEVLEQTP